MSSTLSQTFTIIQGAHSPTLTPPPLDENLTFAEVLAFHAEHSASHKLFVYPVSGTEKSINYAMAFDAQKRAAGIVKSAYEASGQLYVDRVARPVFGILATAGK